MIELDVLDFVKGNGTVTVVTQDAVNGAVLMVAAADREALARTLRSGEMHYRSRTRGAWHKGATSGNVQRVISLTPDCDGDVLLARVVSAGPACHLGTATCFDAVPADALGALDATIAERAAVPANEGRGHTHRLLQDRNLRLKKIGEEAAELVTACADGNVVRATEECADLFYHALVALRAAGGSLAGVRATLASRAARSSSA